MLDSTDLIYSSMRLAIVINYVVSNMMMMMMIRQWGGVVREQSL